MITDFMPKWMEKKRKAMNNVTKTGRKCEMCNGQMICTKATKHRGETYDIYWSCPNCKFQLRELDRRI